MDTWEATESPEAVEEDVERAAGCVEMRAGESAGKDNGTEAMETVVLVVVVAAESLLLTATGGTGTVTGTDAT